MTQAGAELLALAKLIETDTNWPAKISLEQDKMIVSALRLATPAQDREELAQVCINHSNDIPALMKSIDAMRSGTSITLDGIERDIITNGLRLILSALNFGGRAATKETENENENCSMDVGGALRADECQQRIVEQLSHMNRTVVTPEGYSARDVALKCEFHDRRPALAEDQP